MELWDLYTEDRKKTGKTMIRGEKQPEGFYRIVVHVCIFNEKNQMLIQQRVPFKDDWKNLWDITVGGSAIAGENSRTAAARELKEELGIEIDFSNTKNARHAFTLNFHGGFDDFYIIKKDVDLSALKFQKEEVQNAKWASKDEIFALIDEKKFIPYHKSLIDLLFFQKDNEDSHTQKDFTE